jgi:hypothetical protein
VSPRQQSGGCQCGRIRYVIAGEFGNASICHCRMCQKASGQLFGAFASTTVDAFAWTRGTPSMFASSSVVERGFCRDCGTNLTFRYTNTDRISVTVGSLDAPETVVFRRQYGLEGRLPSLDTAIALPGVTTEAAVAPEVLPKLASRQHPDHDTEAWSARP